MIFSKNSLSLLFCIFIVTLQGLNAQILILKGMVLDAQTKDPLPYVSIGISKKGIGTSTNEEGVFTLKLSSNFKQDTITIICVGYENENIAVPMLLAQSNIQIYLEKAMQSLPEVSLNAEVGLHIIKKVIANLPQNYDYSESYSYRVFLHKNYYHSNQHSYLLESVFDIAPRKFPKNCPIVIKKVRAKAFDAEGQNYIKSETGITMHSIASCFLIHSTTDCLIKNKLSKFSYNIQNEYVWENDTIIVLTVSLKKAKTKNELSEDTLHIKKSDYAIIYFGGAVKERKDDYLYRYQATYEKYKQKYHLKRAFASSTHDSKEGKIYNSRHFFVTNINDTLGNFPKELQFDKNYTEKITHHIKDFQDSFWEDYNVIEHSKTLPTNTINQPKETKNIPIDTIHQENKVESNKIQEKGRFSMVFPAKPTKSTGTKVLPTGEKIEAVGYSLVQDEQGENAIDFYYNFGYSDFPTDYDQDKLKAQTLKIIENTQKPQAFNLKLINKDENGKLHQHHAIVSTYVDEENGLYMKQYIMIASQRIYMISIAKGDSMPTQTEIDTYLSGLNIMKP